MRALLALALLVLTASASGAAVRPAPSGFGVRPNIADPLCNAGRGVRLTAGLGSDTGVASARLADGSPLVALSSGYPAATSAVLGSVTRECAPNSGFGSGGVARIAITGPRPGRASQNELWVNAVAPRKGGGAILAGSWGADWVVGEVTPRGQLDPAFGNRGWSVLPFHGAAVAALQEPSGRIVIAGDDEGGGCCNRNWAAALSPRGRLESGFGTHGRTELPTGEDSAVDGRALEPNGDVLAKVGYGNMGCWGEGIAMLTPSGRPVPGFAQRLDRFWKRLGFSAFVGDAVADGDGSTLAGTGQTPCFERSSAPSATGLLARFRTDGEQIGRTVRFASRMDGDVEAFRNGDDTVVDTSFYADATRLTLTARRPDGSVDFRFGSHGVVTVRTPWTGRNATLDTTVLLSAAGPGSILVVARRYGSNEVRLTRLRF